MGSGAPMTGRQIVMQRLGKAVARATTADLQRAAQFLEWAYQVRKGCAQQRAGARRAQYKRNVEQAEQRYWDRRFD